MPSNEREVPYTPRQWAQGDLIEAEKLKALENAVGAIDNDIVGNGTKITSKINQVVQVSENQPVDELNKVWVRSEIDSISVPTEEEFEIVKAKVKDANETIFYEKAPVSQTFIWHQGTIDETTGVRESSPGVSNAINTTISLPMDSKITKMHIENGYKMKIFKYAVADQAYIECDSQFVTGYRNTGDLWNVKFAILVMKSDESAILVSNPPTISYINGYGYTDNSLTTQGRAADAKAVGDSLNTVDGRLMTLEQTDIPTLQSIATVQGDTVATRAYAVGEYFTLNNKLYKVTTAIAQNEIIIPQAQGISNYNCTEIINGLSNEVQEVASVANAATAAVTNISSSIATVETSNIASHAIAADSYFILDNVLYKAMSDIAIGDTIVTTGTGANAAQVPGGVTGEVADLKSALQDRTLYAITDTDLFDWQAKWRVNSTKKGYTTNVEKYAGLGKPKATSGIYPVFVYAGSTIMAKTGYTMDYSVVTEYSTGTVLESKRGISAGTIITISNNGILLLSVTDGSTAVTTTTEAKALAKSGLEVNLLCKTVKDEISDKLDKYQGTDNVGKIMQVGNDGLLTPAIIPTDDTLQQSGVPADAKTVGENILLSIDSGSIVYTIGGFNSIGNTNDTLTTQVRTKSPVKVGEYGGTIGCDEGYEIRVFNYSAAAFTVENLISKSNFTSNTVELIPNTYVGFSIRNSTPTEQTNVSNSEHLIINIPEQTVAEAVKKLINGDLSAYNHGPFDLYRWRFGDWYSGLQEDYTGFSRTTKYADIIAAFDALMALDAQYISKNTLGTASGTDSGGNSYTMYEYVFKPKNYTSGSLNTKKVPKIYIDGSVHGFEKCGTFGLYYFLKDLVVNWDKNASLAAIRQSVEIHVIPVSNPYGFDNFIYKNGNGVNINRNFDHNGEWIVVPDGNQQNGLAPFDQPESAIIRDWILADEENILCYLPLHTNGMWNVSNYGEMNASMPSSDRYDDYYNRIFRVITNHIEEQTIRWPLMYENIRPGSSTFCGKIQASVTEASTKGTASQWANTMRRIVSMTFEGFNGININDVQIVETFSAQAQKMNSENIGNIVIQMLREYSD